MRRREFLRGLLIASVAVGVGKLIPEEQNKDVALALKDQVEGKSFHPRSILLMNGAQVKIFCTSKEMLEDEEVFNEMMDEYGIPDRKPDEVKIGYFEVDEDWAKDVIRVVLKYKAA